MHIGITQDWQVKNQKDVILDECILDVISQGNLIENLDVYIIVNLVENLQMGCQ